MEIAVVKVRPSYDDKKMHVLRFLIPDAFFSSDLIRLQLRKMFPFGFFSPKIERFMIDYAFTSDNKEFVELCNHDYLAKYLNSEKKIE